METNNDDEILQQLLQSEENESPSAYAGFLFFVNLPVTERYGEGVAERVAEATSSASDTVTTWRAANHWFARVKLIDAHFARMQFNQRFKANEEHNLRFAEKARKLQEEVLENSQLAAQVVKNLLSNINLGMTVKPTDFVKVLQDDGSHKVMPITTKIEMNAKMSEIASLMNAAASCPSRVAGLPIENVPLESRNLQGDFAGKTDDEIKAMQNKIAKEKAKLFGTQSIDGVQ
jgi:hypothetical protein